MAKKDPRVDAYIEKSAAFAQPILVHLRDTVHAACPDVEEAMKWSFPHFMYKGMLCSMASFTQHCAFGFWKGSLLLDGAKDSDAMGQFGRITSIKDLPPKRTLVGYIKQAAALNDAGVKVGRKRKPARPAPKPAAPADLAAALTQHKKAKATFGALSPSHQREYIEWITEAKSAATRARRLDQTIVWLTEGKSRNWKYERRSPGAS